jgi:L-aspartate oxidase
LVFGARAVEAAAEYAGHVLRGRGASVAQAGAAGEAEGDRGDHLDMEKLLNSLRRLMWEKVGIIRSKQGLLSALAQLEKWEERVRDRCRTRRELEVQNMVTVGHLVATAALQREHSLGAHFRSDHPAEFASGWDRHTQLHAEAPGRALVRGSGLKA